MSGGQLVPIERIFNVAEQQENFVPFMEELRSAVADPSRQVNGLPITRPLTRGAPRQLLRLTMQVGDASVILLVRTDNLYVQGFEQPQRNNMCWEFGSTGKEQKDKGKNKKAKKKNDAGQSQQHLLPSSRFLGFGPGYTDLGPGTGIGWQELVQSIIGLARYGGPGGDQVKAWLQTIFITVSESLRLREVCEEVGRLLGQCRSGVLDQRMCDLIRAWGKLSREIIDWVNNPEGDDAARYRHMLEFCTSSEEACNIVCIVNHGPAVERRQKREAAWPGRAIVVDDVPEGSTLAEIFSVAVDGGRRNNVYAYGHIAIEDGLSSVVLFRRGRTGAQLISPGGLVELTGPSRAAWACDEVVLHVDLMSVSYVPDMTPDKEIGSGRLVWNTYDPTQVVYDEVEEYVFEGLDGSVNVRCALVTNAVVATVVVERIVGTGNVELYGTIAAATDKFGPADKVTLFDRDRKHAVAVRAGGGIPLLRSVAVVPLGWPLRISADLSGRATIADMTPDVRIVKRDAVFYPRKDRSEDKVIDGIAVHVTWSCN